MEKQALTWAEFKQQVAERVFRQEPPPPRPSVTKSLALGGGGLLLGGAALRRMPHNFKRLNRFLGDDVANAIRTKGVAYTDQKMINKDLAGMVNARLLSDKWRQKVQAVVPKPVYASGEALASSWRKKMNTLLNTSTRQNNKKLRTEGATTFDAFLDSKRVTPGPRIGPTASDEAILAADRKMDVYRAFESSGLAEYTPKTVSLADIKVRGKGKGQQKLRDVLGTEPFIKMDDFSHGTLPSDRLTFDDITKDYRDTYVAQAWADVKKLPWLHRQANKSPVAQKWFSSIYGKGRTIPDLDEYRVHVINGKVPPWTTSRKWSVLDYLVPRRTTRVAKLEKDVQDIVDRMLASNSPDVRKLDLKNQVLGFDVGLARRGGKPVVFEINPTVPEHLSKRFGTDATYGSGQLTLPLHRQALIAQAAGKMPWMQKFQIGKDVAQTGLGGSLVYKGANPWLTRQE